MTSENKCFTVLTEENEELTIVLKNTKVADILENLENAVEKKGFTLMAYRRVF